MYHPHFDFDKPLEPLSMMLQSMAKKVTKPVNLIGDKLAQPLLTRDVHPPVMITVTLEIMKAVQEARGDVMTMLATKTPRKMMPACSMGELTAMRPRRLRTPRDPLCPLRATREEATDRI